MNEKKLKKRLKNITNQIIFYIDYQLLLNEYFQKEISGLREYSKKVAEETLDNYELLMGQQEQLNELKEQIEKLEKKR